ncbi:MAG: nitrogenase component 1 [Byssovorax sp.]
MSRLFPEIDGKPAPRPPAAGPAQEPARPAPAESPLLQRFARLLDLGRHDPRARIEGVHRVGSAAIAVTIGVGPRAIELRFLPRSEAPAEGAGGARPRGTALSTPHLCIERPGPPSTAEEVALMRYVAYRVHNAPLDLLLRAAAGAPLREPSEGAGTMDPDVNGGSQGQGEQGRGEASGLENEDSFVFSYGSPSAWRNFFEGQELYRGACAGIEGRVLTVHHTEIECHASTVPTRDGTMSFFNYVRSEQSRGAAGAYLMTDLDDRDVIKGGGSKLDRILDEVAKSDVPMDMILVQSSCVPIVTGDDVEASIDKLRRKVRVPVLNLDNSSDPSAELVRLAMAEPGFFATEKRPGSINVVGLPSIPGHDDLFRALDECGISLNCRLLPSVDLGTFRRYLAADLQVHYGWEWQSPACRALISEIPLPAIEPPPPFGLAGSHAWLAAVAAALGQSERFDAVWAARCAPIAARWEALSAEARGYRLGFVVDDRSLDKLADPERLMGIPVVTVIEEMGFGVDLFVYRPEGGAVRGARGFSGAEVIPFSSRAELEAAMRASPAVAFYSELHFDRRLSRTGKNLFSLADFEMGPRGALRTLTRLLARCRLPFFRSYGAYLGDPFAPVAAPAAERSEP